MKVDHLAFLSILHEKKLILLMTLSVAGHMKNWTYTRRITPSLQNIFLQCPDGPQRILNNKPLYLGSVRDSADMEKLQKLQIKNILVIAPESQCPSFFLNDINYMRIILDDDINAPISEIFVWAWQFIEDALRKKQAVLIHCQMGISRSATIVISYLMISAGMKLDTAIAHIRRLRPVINPNRGFLKQLRALEQKLFARKTKAGVKSKAAVGRVRIPLRSKPPLP